MDENETADEQWNKTMVSAMLAAMERGERVLGLRTDISADDATAIAIAVIAAASQAELEVNGINRVVLASATVVAHLTRVIG